MLKSEHFPLHAPLRAALEHFEKGPGELPKGIASARRATLMSRKWLIRSERIADFGAERYALTSLGKEALARDRQLAKAREMKMPDLH